MSTGGAWPVKRGETGWRRETAMNKLLSALLSGAALLTQTGCFDIIAEDGAGRPARASAGLWYDHIGSWFDPAYEWGYYETDYYVDEWVVEEDYWVEEEYWVEDDSSYDEEYYDEWYYDEYYYDDWYYDDWYYEDWGEEDWDYWP
jgi:hypothetical protein